MKSYGLTNAHLALMFRAYTTRKRSLVVRQSADAKIARKCAALRYAVMNTPERMVLTPAGEERVRRWSRLEALL